MSGTPFRLIGRGVYSLRDAHRLTRVPIRRIRRWTYGYSYRYRGNQCFSPAVVPTDIPVQVGSAALDFGDLLEVRFLNAFREHGVSWKAIRIASERARDILGVRHPFSSRRFSTDGHTILAEFVTDTGDEILLDLVHNQYEFNRIIAQYLFGEIEFGDDDAPARWWPVASSHRIVIDPQRAFGAPIVDVEGVPTEILARAVLAEDSVEVVADLYEVDPISVTEAVEFELAHPTE